MLAREENWSVWKNDGCASYVREKVPAPSKTQAGRQVLQQCVLMLIHQHRISVLALLAVAGDSCTHCQYIVSLPFTSSRYSCTLEQIGIVLYTGTV